MSPGWDRRPFLETQNPKFVELCGDERKNLRINHSSCTEKQPMRNRATRQLIALWLFEAW